LIADKAGNLYGTAVGGGAYSVGVVFELSPPAWPHGRWTETVLYSFGGFSTDGVEVTGSLAFGDAGYLYGTSASGGTHNYGTVFELSPPTAQGLPWTETILYNFAGNSDGSLPFAGPVIDKAGNLYGVTYAGGNDGYGTVFALNRSSEGTWNHTVLHSFRDADDGKFPYASLMIDGFGALYGVAPQGGKYGYGTAFKVTP
jgi:uncharacterized repeat protein (TIGR03803 family)